MEYASKATGNAALTTGIIGTSLGVLSGGLSALTGARAAQHPPMDPGDRPVTRYEMGLWQQINAKDVEIAQLKAERYTDAAMSQQMVWNATQQGLLVGLQQQVSQLQSMTQMIIPNANVMPGWGSVAVSAASSQATSG